MNDLPLWVKQQNDKSFPASIMAKDWNTLLPISDYDLSAADSANYEHSIVGEKTVTFPHKLHTLDSAKYESFKYTPFANTYTFNMAKAAIENEKPGSNNVTDFLTISISSTDYAGHWFGPNSRDRRYLFTPG